MKQNVLWSAIGLAVASLTMAAVPQPAHALPTLVVDGGGILTGVNDVDIGGTLYDVEFLDGTCAGIFGSCDAASFAFQTLADALAASSALESQVFGSGDIYDTTSEKTAGCISPVGCFIATPYAATSFVNIAYLHNNFSSFADDVFSTGFAPDVDFALVGNYTWARWTAADPVRDVPEPAPAGLMAGLLLALGVYRAKTLRQGIQGQ